MHGNDNYAFTLAGDQLLTKKPYDREDAGVLGTDFSFRACIRSTDPYGLYADGVFDIAVTNVNEAPVDIALTSWHVAENSGDNATIGILSTLDDDDGDTHGYSLVDTPDCLGSDWDSFKFDDSDPTELEAKHSFDAETKDTYYICVRSTDAGGKSLDKAFAISVDYVNEAPVAVNDPAAQFILANTGDAHEFDVLANDTDPEGDGLFVAEISTVTPPEAGTVSLVDAPYATGVEFTPFAGYSGPVQFTYKAQEDQSGLARQPTTGRASVQRRHCQLLSGR